MPSPAPRPIEIRVPEVAPGAVGGLFDAPRAPRGDLACLLAHGAGAGIEAPLLAAVAAALAARGVPTLRFRYPYMERVQREGRRRPPDRAPALAAAHRAALAALRERAPGARVLLGGKSLGGRVASLLAAEGAAAAGLFFLGYPLHPAGRPERLRSEHFGALALPTLFLQGTRDALCELELLERERARFPRPPRVALLEGADHDFQVLRRSGRTAEAVRAELLEALFTWLADEGLAPPE